MLTQTAEMQFTAALDKLKEPILTRDNIHQIFGEDNLNQEFIDAAIFLDTNARENAVKLIDKLSNNNHVTHT